MHCQHISVPSATGPRQGSPAWNFQSQLQPLTTGRLSALASFISGDMAVHALGH